MAMKERTISLTQKSLKREKYYGKILQLILILPFIQTSRSFQMGFNFGVHRCSWESYGRQQPLVTLDRRHRTSIYSSNEAIPYSGPIYDYTNSEETMSVKLQLLELGIDAAVGKSAVAPGQLGLFIRCSESVETVTIPEGTLLCGYGKPGTFQKLDEGDKTVGFVLRNHGTAIFLNRQLMEVGEALLWAANELGNGTCGLAGHELSWDEKMDELVIQPIEGFDRYYCPNMLQNEEEITIQNLGQFSNDLAWNFFSPPTSREYYDDESSARNCIQLAWRLEYDATHKCLLPSWPVSVFSRDVRFENNEFMEVGTRYGWGYWQATVNLEDLK
jgi:hypothetical protein